MNKRHFFSLTAVATVFAFVLGCGSSSKSGGPGLTEAELKKLMDPAVNPPPESRVLETTAEETMQGLTYPMSADIFKSALAGARRRVSGKVLEVSSAESESPFLVLDGGTHQDKAYRVKCIFAADQTASLKRVKAGDEVRVEGTSDGVINEVTLEFKNCILSSATDEETSSDASDASKEKSTGTKP